MAKRGRPFPATTPLKEGERFGRLIVVRQTDAKDHGSWLWLLTCDCGGAKQATASALRRGDVRSCGCMRRELINRIRPVSHGMSGTRTHASWSGMITRCANPRASDYRLYGERGITVCSRWSDFAAFYADMGERPAGMSLDRIDNDGDYEPANCRWATGQQQGRNRRTNRVVSYDGRSMPLVEAIELSGLSAGLVRCRLGMGWPLNRALTERVHRKERSA